MRKFISGGVAFAVACLTVFSGCRPRNFNQNLSDVAQSGGSGGKTMCLSVMGNGANFPAHIGPMVALLERGYTPVAAGGSSSASITVPFLMALLSNPSLSKKVYDANGNELSLPQKAALVLGASSKIFDVFLFLPSLKNIGGVIKSLALYAKDDHMGDVFLNTPDMYFSNAPAIVGQSMFAVDFFAHADFSNVIAQASMGQRSGMVFDMWKTSTDAIEVSPSEFINTLLRPLSTAKDIKRADAIKMRYYEIFMGNLSADHQSGRAAMLQNEATIQKFAQPMSLISETALADVYSRIVMPERNVPFVGALVSTVTHNFFLPSSDSIYHGWLGQARDGTPITIPPGTIIHTTARVADHHSNGTSTFRPGIGFFYQTYFPSQDILPDLLRKNASLAANESLLSYPTSDGSLQNVISRTHQLIFNQPLLKPAMMASISEPGAFAGTEIEISDDDRSRMQVNFGSGYLATYGGWFESVSLKTLSRLDACKNVDRMVYISINPFVNSFQRKALRGVVEGEAALIKKTEIEPLKEATGNSAFARFYNALGYFIRYSKSITAKQKTLAFEWDWDHPSAITGDLGNSMSGVIQANRSAFVLASYQNANKILDAEGTQQSNQFVFDTTNDIPVDRMATEAAVNQAVQNAFH